MRSHHYIREGEQALGNGALQNTLGHILEYEISFFFINIQSYCKELMITDSGDQVLCLSARLKEGAAEETATEEDEDGKNSKDTAGISFKILYETYEALKSDDRGSRMKTTKEGFIYNILMFLQKQGLIEYVVQDEMIKTTRKLDNFMDWNLLNQNNYQRVLRVLGVVKDE